MSPAERAAVVDSVLSAIRAMKGQRFSLSGDLNIDLLHSTAEEASKWRSTLREQGIHAINQESE